MSLKGSKTEQNLKDAFAGSPKPIVVIYISPLRPMLKDTTMLLRYSVQLPKVRLAMLMAI